MPYIFIHAHINGQVIYYRYVHEYSYYRTPTVYQCYQTPQTLFLRQLHLISIVCRPVSVGHLQSALSKEFRGARLDSLPGLLISTTGSFLPASLSGSIHHHDRTFTAVVCEKLRTHMSYIAIIGTIIGEFYNQLTKTIVSNADQEKVSIVNNLSEYTIRDLFQAGLLQFLNFYYEAPQGYYLQHKQKRIVGNNVLR